jgi:hypothetical protein
MSCEAEVEADVRDELVYDPTINAAQADVASEHRTVILKGSMPSFTEKWAAERAEVAGPRGRRLLCTK